MKAKSRTAEIERLQSCEEAVCWRMKRVCAGVHSAARSDTRSTPIMEKNHPHSAGWVRGWLECGRTHLRSGRLGRPTWRTQGYPPHPRTTRPCNENRLQLCCCGAAWHLIHLEPQLIHLFPSGSVHYTANLPPSSRGRKV
jgi:hypothetical protein